MAWSEDRIFEQIRIVTPMAAAKAIAPGRWLRTGDMGHFDGEFLYINTRARDLILRNAENIYPVEVEHCLELHPEIIEAAVIGVPHPEMGQEVKAVVVVRESWEVDIPGVETFCRDRLAAFASRRPQGRPWPRRRWRGTP